MDSLLHESGKDLLADLAAAIPGLPIVTPTSSEYSSLRATYVLHNPAVPLAIVRPRSAEDVATVIHLARSRGVKISVRSGGHDVFGRSIVHDALVLDMRSLKMLEVSGDRKTAKIGGGILVGDLIDQLSSFSLITPFGSIPTVGYTGWATLGGYGPTAANFGLGVDQIVGARLANWKGELIEADAETLKGIRGGGGNFGVVVELTIKVYPLKDMLAGFIIYDSSNLGQLVPNYFRSYQSMNAPSSLGLTPIVANHPQLGRTMLVSFVWSSNDTEAGMEWLGRICALGSVISNTVAEIKITAWMEMVQAVAPSGVWGGDSTVNLRTLSESTAKIIAKHIEKMPSDGSNGIVIHELRGPSAKNDDSSVFGAREPHYMLELIGSVLDKANMEGSQNWITEFHGELKKTGETMKVEYLALSKPGDALVSDCFGSNWEFLMDLKRKCDPEGVFDMAVPRLNGNYAM